MPEWHMWAFLVFLIMACVGLDLLLDWFQSRKKKHR
jgi:hypothetical protein